MDLKKFNLQNEYIQKNELLTIQIEQMQQRYKNIRNTYNLLMQETKVIDENYKL